LSKGRGEILEYDNYGSTKLDYAINFAGKIDKDSFPGAIRISIKDMHPKIADVKYSELAYNHLTESVWVHVRQEIGLTLWIVPKKGFF